MYTWKCSTLDSMVSAAVYGISVCSLTIGCLGVQGLTHRLGASLLSGSIARTRPACLLDRRFPENLIFGQAKISMENLPM